MVQRICPVCDQIMKSAHYCRTCRQWVKNPWVRDVDYYLNERHPRNEADCTYHERNPKRNPERKLSQTQGTKKSVSLVFVIIIALYLTFMLAGTVLRGSVWSLLSVGSGGSSYIGYEKAETALAQPSYQELEDADVIASGEACNSRKHFDIQGELLLDPVREALEVMGYEAEDYYSYSANEIYNSGETWFETVISMELAPGDGDGAYQYVEINYDTATGELHEVDVVMSDGWDAAETAAAVLQYLEAAGEVDQECAESVREAINAALLSGDDNVYCAYGDVEVSGYSHSDGWAIYISHIWD